MQVKDLIQLLNGIENKELEVVLAVYDGFGRYPHYAKTPKYIHNDIMPSSHFQWCGQELRLFGDLEQGLNNKGDMGYPCVTYRKK